mmetsp:Transcript_23250/g.36907  ORF Transcript_23250/g.36907 Transcript_23250/m.36907 type:complete len:408 (-) Transcript_23250:61-1284(-)
MFLQHIPARHKCYPNLDEGNGQKFSSFICLCNRSLTFTGEGCSEASPWSHVFNSIRLIAIVCITAVGSKVALALFKRRYSSRQTTPLLAALWSCTSTLMVNFALCIDVSCDVIRLLYDDTWYNDYGGFVIQELVVFFSVLSSLSISIYFWGKVQELNLMRKRTLKGLSMMLISFQIAVPTVSMWAWLSPGNRTAENIGDLFHSFVAGVCLITLAVGGLSLGQRLTVHPGTSVAAQTISQRARLTLFTKRYSIWMVAIICSDLAWTYCDKNYTHVPALCANITMMFVYLCFSGVSYTIYSFIRPQMGTSPREDRALHSILGSIFAGWIQVIRQRGEGVGNLNADHVGRRNHQRVEPLRTQKNTSGEGSAAVIVGVETKYKKPRHYSGGSSGGMLNGSWAFSRINSLSP